MNDNALLKKKALFGLLAGMLVIDFGSVFYLLVEPQAIWISPFSQISMFLLTAILIWLERKNLANYHLDRLSILILIAFRSLFHLGYDLGLLPTAIVEIIFWLISGTLLMKFRPEFALIPKVTKKNLLTTLIAMGIGAGLGLMPFLLVGQSFGENPNLSQTFSSFLLGVWYTLSNASIDEEPLFRGFLWGYLRDLGWRDGQICLFQAALFVVRNIGYWQSPLFWLFTPFMSILLGVLAWRSRSIAASMAAHAGYNAWFAVFSHS